MKSGDGVRTTGTGNQSAFKKDDTTLRSQENGSVQVAGIV